MTATLPAGERWPDHQDLRSWLRLLAERGELGTVRRPVAERFEAAGFLSRLDGHKAVLFKEVEGKPFELVGNTVLNRTHVALALGCRADETVDAFGRAAASPRACARVEPDAAPVLAERLAGDDVLSQIPIPIHHERDGGRYLSSGVLVARDPSSGRQNLSINRLQVSGPDTLRMLVLPGRLRAILADAEAAGEDLQVVICLGVDPTFTLASQVRAGRHVDDLEVCSALRATPLPVTRAPSLDLDIPAEAELVIETRVRSGVREMEGPFGEFPRTYSPPAPGPVLDVVGVWHRPDAIVQTILSAGREHFLVGGIPRETDLLTKVRGACPNTERVRMTEGGSCRMHAVVALRDPKPGDAMNAVLAALGSNPVLKLVTVVDADVDIFADEEVEWAVATRVQADRDVTIISGGAGSSLDPSARGGTTARMGIDATRPPDEGDYERMRVPGAETLDLERDVEPA